MPRALYYSALMITRHMMILACSALLLSGCSTWEGLQRDFGTAVTSVGKSVDNLSAKTQKAEPAPVVYNGGGNCPTIIVDPQLDRMSEFYDMEKPSASSEVSTIRLAGTQSECELEGEFLNMRIDLNFAGNLGPKAKRKESDRPFFAYPYFIAVSDGEGNELARELFAASVTYNKNQDSIELVETIRQRLPLNDDGSVPSYQVQIGFQLTEDQLFYNASL